MMKMQFSEKLKKIVAKVSENRSMKKLALGVAVGICCVGVASGNSYAAYSSTTYGVHNISNPTNSGTTVYEKRTTPSMYNFLYFGKIPSGNSNYESTAQGKEMYWRVLNTTANDDNNTPALFVLTEYGYPTVRRWHSSGQTYSGSEVQTFLNSTMYGECFTEKEKTAILQTKKTEYSNFPLYSGDVVYAYLCGLSNQYMFLLSALEVEQSRYGFAYTTQESTLQNTTDVNRICKQGASGGSTRVWWLRSGCSNSGETITYVKDDGAVDTGATSNGQNNAVRSALNINLASVILTSPASIAGSSSTLSSLASNAPSAAAGSTESTSNASRLTIYDSSRNSFSVSPSSISQKAGSIIFIKYSGMPTTGSDYVSVLLYNSDKSVVYYGRLKSVGTLSGSGIATMTVPSISTGTYTLRVLNEYQETDRKTSYAGYKDITLTVTSSGDTRDAEPPKVTNVYTNGNNTYYKITANDSAGLWAITNPSDTTILKDMTSLGTSGTVNVGPISATTELNVYGGSGRRIVKESNMDILTDTTAPSIDSVTYSNGNYIITVSDAESGVWKITDASGNTLSGADYST